MSLEQALNENTAALTRMADLLEISNAARSELIAQNGGGSPTPTPAASSDNGNTVAEIKAAAKGADKPTLEAMLKEETEGKNRTTAVDAIKAAIAALEPADAGNEATTDTPAAGTPEANTAETSTSNAPAATDDKNAQPVPAEVSGEATKKAFGDWFGETDDEDERMKRRAFIEQVTNAIGAKVSEADLPQRRQAIFFLRRKRAGIEIDFSAAYDFNGSPTQDAPAAAPAADDLL